MAKAPTVLVSGSVAYDFIMNYNGKFADAILPDQIHQLSVAFLIKDQSQQFGGNAANIAYNLRLVAKNVVGKRAGRKLFRPYILASVGNDAKPYIKRLKKLNAQVDFIQTVKSLPSAAAYIMSDQSNNQITAFYSAAQDQAVTKNQKIMKRLRKVAAKTQLALIGPGNASDMSALAKLYAASDIAYIADPGQQITSLTVNQLKTIVQAAEVLTVNDYELALILKKLNTTLPELRKQLPLIIVTLGAKGSKWYRGRSTKTYSAVKVKKVIDPTGAGDAYRAGVITGLLHSWDDATTANVAALLATYTIETHGTQEHNFTKAEFATRFKRAFKADLSI